MYQLKKRFWKLLCFLSLHILKNNHLNNSQVYITVLCAFWWNLIFGRSAVHVAWRAYVAEVTLRKWEYMLKTWTQITFPKTCGYSLVLYFGDHIGMTEGKPAHLMFDRANTNEPVVLGASPRKEFSINLTAVLSHAGNVLPWNSAKPFISVTRLTSFVFPVLWRSCNLWPDQLFHPSTW